MSESCVALSSAAVLQLLQEWFISKPVKRGRTDQRREIPELPAPGEVERLERGKVGSGA